MDARLSLLQAWLDGLASPHALVNASLRRASDDASFRRYFRVDRSADDGPASCIVMDAPPPQEDCRPFLAAARVLAEAGLSVPTVLEADLERGFLLLSDLGQTTYLDELSAKTAPALYRDACASLVRLQLATRPGVFADYDHALLLREMALYPDWYVGHHKGLVLAPPEREALDAVFDLIARQCLSQPRVFVHRDYHSRNLMVLETDSPGVLDFQDAVLGPITYDLVSLLRDAYIAWDEEQVLDWVIRYWERARAAGLPMPEDFGAFYRDFEWMGLQRHLKVLGIFARLSHRDGKHRYLQDLPRVLGYVRPVVQRYGALAPLAHLIDRIEGQERQSALSF